MSQSVTWREGESPRELPRESVSEIREDNREIQPVLIIMCDPSENQTNEGQETPETSEAPVAVEAVGVEGTEKKEEVAEPVKVEEAKKPSGISLPMTGANDDWMDDDVGLTMDDSDEEEDVKVEAEVPNSEDNKAKESIVSDTTEEKKEEAGSEQENTTTTCLTSESNSTEKDIEDANKKTAKTVAGILTRVKEDTEMTDMEKIDTLCLLLSKFVEENGV